MEPFAAFLYSWHLDEEDGIHAFGLTPENKSVHLDITGFTPYMYMELPDNMEWTSSRKESILAKISEFDDEIQPVVKSFMNKRRLYQAHVTKTDEGYKYKTFPYLFLAFRKRRNLLGFVKKMRYGIYIPSLGRKIAFKFHEQDASSVLQLTCCRDIPVTGWVSGRGKPILENKYSICDYEYELKWNNISKCTDEAILKAVPAARILVFDCEANSDNIATMPKNRPNDKIFQISFAVMSYGRSEITTHLLSLGTPDPAKLAQDTILHTYSNEGDLLCGFADLIVKIDPQIISGYNILGWDFMYLIKRAKFNNVMSHFSQYGYLVGIQAKEKEISWSSSAFNSQHFLFLDAPGRLLIDMLPIIKRDFKFSRYDLGSVSTEILGQTKDPLTHKGIFKCYRIFSPSSLSLVGKYCVQDSLVTLKLFDKLKTWVGSCQMSSTFGVSIIDLYTQGQQLKIYSQVYRDCLNKNIVVEKDGFVCGENESYTGAIVLEPEPGLYDDVTTLDFASLYPSVIIANNVCYSTYVTNKDIPNEDCHIFDYWDHQGCLHDTTKRTTKIKNPICAHRYYRFLKEPIGVIPALLTHLISERKKTRKEMEQVLNMAKEEKDEEKKKGLLLYAGVLDMRQLALKVSSNSMYGGMGVRRGKLPFMPGAMVTAAGGRDALMLAKKIMLEKYPGKVIYGDTDSLMYIFENMERFKDKDGNTDYAALEEYALKAGADVSQAFPPPMKLEFENIAKKFLIFTKKRYICQLSNKKQKIKGVMNTRRDNAPVARNLYAAMNNIIMTGCSFNELEIFLIDELNALYSHKFQTKDYSITKSIKEIDQYAVKKIEKDPAKRKKQFANKFLDSEKHTDADFFIRSLPAHVQLAEKMRRRGMFVEAGSRIEFVITETGGIKGKIWQKIESVAYYKDHSEIIRLDMNYYLKSLINPGDQALETAYKIKKWFKTQYKYRCIKSDCMAEIRSMFRKQVILINE